MRYVWNDASTKRGDQSDLGSSEWDLDYGRILGGGTSCYLETKQNQSHAQDTFQKEEEQRLEEFSFFLSFFVSPSASHPLEVSHHKRRGCCMMDGGGASDWTGSCSATLHSSCSFSIQLHSQMTALGGTTSPTERKHHILPASPPPHSPPWLSGPDLETLLYFYGVQHTAP